MTITYQQLQDAIGSIEMHHFRGTGVVACCLVRTNGHPVISIAAPQEGELFDITTVSAQAKTGAERQLATDLERELAPPVDPAPPAIEPPPLVVEVLEGESHE